LPTDSQSEALTSGPLCGGLAQRGQRVAGGTEGVRNRVRLSEQAVGALVIAFWQGDVTHPSQRVLDRVGHPDLPTLDQGALVGLPVLAQLTGAVQGDAQV